MKRLLLAAVLYALLILGLSAQYQYWQNYCETSSVSNIALDGQTLWAVSGALLELDTSTQQFSLHDHANSPLPTNDFNDVAIDPQGALWLTTNIGLLVKYDGQSVQSFPAPMELTEIVVRGVNDIWMGSGQNGLQHFDGNSVQSVYAGGERVPELWLDRLGRIWFTVEEYFEPYLTMELYCHDGQTFDWIPNAPVSHNINSIAFDQNNQLWVACYGSGLASFDGNYTWTYYNPGNSGLLDFRVTCLAFDALNRLWIGTTTGINCLADGVWSAFTPQNSGIGDRYLFDLCISPQQDVWFASHDGLIKISSGTLEVIDTAAQGLPGGYILDQSKDAQGNWCIIIGYNVFRLGNGLFTQIPIPSPDFTPGVICHDASGKMWLGYRVLMSYDGSQWQVYDGSVTGLGNGYIRNIVPHPDGSVWVASEDGVAHYDGSTWSAYTSANSALPYSSIRDVCVDAQGGVWCAGATFVASLQDGTWSVSYPSADGVSPSGIIDLEVWDSQIWLCSGNNLFYRDGNTWHRLYHGNSYLPNAEFRSLDKDDLGYIWIATYEAGLVRLNGNAVRIYNRSNSGLQIDRVRYAQVDDDGRIWVANWYEYLSLFDHPQAVPNLDPVLCPVPELSVWPNPFAASTRVSFVTSKAGPCELGIYDLRGRKLRSLPAVQLRSGLNTLDLSAEDDRGRRLPSGIYVIRVKHSEGQILGKVSVVGGAW